MFRFYKPTQTSSQSAGQKQTMERLKIILGYEAVPNGKQLPNDTASNPSKLLNFTNGAVKIKEYCTPICSRRTCVYITASATR
jgi:hypothetical protein